MGGEALAGTSGKVRPQQHPGQGARLGTWTRGGLLSPGSSMQLDKQSAPWPSPCCLVRAHSPFWKMRE